MYYFNVIVCNYKDYDTPYEKFLVFTFYELEEAFEFAQKIMFDWDNFSVQILRFKNDERN